MRVVVKPFPGGVLYVDGSLTREEPDVGLPESFEISSITADVGDITDLLEWAASRGKYGNILSTIEELCLENLKQ